VLHRGPGKRGVRWTWAQLEQRQTCLMRQLVRCLEMMRMMMRMMRKQQLQ
jgi:hypothetical protein